MKIDKLTKEQEARFPEFVKKWTDIGLCTLPADRPQAEEGIRLIYQQAGLPIPRIVWTTSPLVSGLVRSIISNYKIGASVVDSVGVSVVASVVDSVVDSVRASVWASVRASVLDSVVDSVRDSVVASVVDSVGDSVRVSVWASVVDSVVDSVRDSVVASVLDSVRASVGASVRVSVWASVVDSVVDSVRVSVRASVFGQYDSAWLGFYDFFSEVCGLKKETTRLKGLWMIAKSANWFLPLSRICWISERPTLLYLNKQGRLHCENGIALAYPDGWGVYALNGIRMKREYILTPANDIKPETILKEENVDIRRELLRKVGVERMVNCGKIIEQNDRYQLVDMSAILKPIRYAPFLLMRNPSIDATHLEGVSPECHTIQEAINWRAGNREVLWTPAMLS